MSKYKVHTFTFEMSCSGLTWSARTSSKEKSAAAAAPAVVAED